MKLSIGSLIARKELIERIINKDFPSKISFKFKLFAKEIAKFFDLYEEERVKLVEKYGEEKDGQIIVEQNSTNWKVFVSELNEVANQEVEIELLDLIENDLIETGVNISARDLLDLEIFFKK